MRSYWPEVTLVTGEVTLEPGPSSSRLRELPILLTPQEAGLVGLPVSQALR